MAVAPAPPPAPPGTVSPQAQGPTGAGRGAPIEQAGETRSARVESLRALAALAVLASHVLLVRYGLGPALVSSYPKRLALEGGSGGVSFFFTLSGYLLFWPFAQRLFDEAQGIDLRRYAINRAVRILPLYYVVLAVLLVVQNHGGSADQWWRFGLFLQNFSATTLNTVDAPMWSLAIEIQFYVLLPLLALVMRRLCAGAPGRAAAGLAVLAVVSFLLERAYVGTGRPRFEWEFSLPTVFYFFAGGMLLALLRQRVARRPPRWLGGLAGRSSAWLAAAAGFWALGAVGTDYRLNLAILLASVLSIGACVLPLRESALSRALEWRVLSRLGTASYSLYLWHYPLLLAIVTGDLRGRTVPELDPGLGPFLGLFAVAITAASGVAMISYALIERPPLRLRRRWQGADSVSRVR